MWETKGWWVTKDHKELLTVSYTLHMLSHYHLHTAITYTLLSPTHVSHVKVVLAGECIALWVSGSKKRAKLGFAFDAGAKSYW